MTSENGPEDPQQPEEVEPPQLADDPPPQSVSIAGIELPHQFDFLRNRLLLAGFAVLAVLLLTAIVLVVLSGNSADDEASASVNETPEKTVVATPSGEFTATVTTTATMRSGPGMEYAIMGTVPEGAIVDVSGRNEDNQWLQIIYPPGSQLRGWVPAIQVDLTGNIDLLPVEGPADAPDVPTDIPVYTPWTWTPEPYVPPQNTPPPPTVPPALPTNTPVLATNTPALPTNTPSGPIRGASVSR
jgi:hypothetical protein